MVSTKEWYARANAAWPKPSPQLTEASAINAARRLWKWGMGEKLRYPIEITSGNRYTWIRSGKLCVNPEKGWHDLIHDLSHLIWRRANVGEEIRPHEKGHAKLELRMVKEVVKRGWLNPEPPKEEAPKPTKQDVQSERYERINARIQAWEAKERRAKNAIKKLREQRAYYERQLSA